jgi:Cdc6-like AAA superfamily ATPase
MNPHDSSFIKHYLKTDDVVTVKKKNPVLMNAQKRTNPFNQPVSVKKLNTPNVTPAFNQPVSVKIINNPNSTPAIKDSAKKLNFDPIPNHSLPSRTLPPSMTASQTGPKLSPQQHQMLGWVLSGHNVFFTGSAGSGKSFLLREIIRVLKAKYGGSPIAVTGILFLSSLNWNCRL